MAKSSTPEIPAKPYPDYPLFWHPRGGWAKKIRGRLVYFGKVSAEAALDDFLDQRDALYAGRVPRSRNEGTTVHELCNAFMEAKELQRDAGELTPRVYLDYHRFCEELLGHLGKRRLVDDIQPTDFSRLKKAFSRNGRGPQTIHHFVVRTKTVFRFAYAEGLLKEPPRYGAVFKVPAKRQIRRARNQAPAKFFSQDEVMAILSACGSPQLRAMVFLGLNCGFNNSDCGHLPTSAIDFKRSWIDFPRTKTEIPRRCPLWSETVLALQCAIKHRPKPKNSKDSGLVFLTTHGKPWAKETTSGPISAEFRKIQQAIGIHKRGRGFNSFRHTFQTIGDRSKDPIAIRAIMGHADQSMSAIYRDHVADEQLRAVVDVVHAWLFPKTEENKS